MKREIHCQDFDLGSVPATPLYASQSSENEPYVWVRGSKPRTSASFLKGIVDMGSNGIRFSVSDLSPPLSRTLPTLHAYRLGISLYDCQFDETGTRVPIPHDIIESVVAALIRFKIVCSDFGVPERNIHVVATEATRGAINSLEFVSAIVRRRPDRRPGRRERVLRNRGADDGPRRREHAANVDHLAGWDDSHEPTGLIQFPIWRCGADSHDRRPNERQAQARSRQSAGEAARRNGRELPRRIRQPADPRPARRQSKTRRRLHDLPLRRRIPRLGIPPALRGPRARAPLPDLPDQRVRRGKRPVLKHRGPRRGRAQSPLDLPSFRQTPHPSPRRGIPRAGPDERHPARHQGGAVLPGRRARGDPLPRAPARPVRHGLNPRPPDPPSQLHPRPIADAKHHALPPRHNEPRHQRLREHHVRAHHHAEGVRVHGSAVQHKRGHHVVDARHLARRQGAARPDAGVAVSRRAAAAGDRVPRVAAADHHGRGGVVGVVFGPCWVPDRAAVPGWGD
ncbi:uncharacterized protein DSM5745_07554 [Aspergillus mulundensis]|uniref:Ppx/GppA phosphatase N-terminal domain-containing protein n=1 Tax=Aspergillus mulundensis TaxID=1810919 RepID=A0A3D8REC3_9EURO|nr:hypothetical protein DSM5745_07554 [Aspergillus mulundensis]RDW72382.1 hypothetical protein DSM5745_07554 [Aspergillus mulundensis]